MKTTQSAPVSRIGHIVLHEGYIASDGSKVTRVEYFAEPTAIINKAARTKNGNGHHSISLKQSDGTLILALNSIALWAGPIALKCSQYVVRPDPPALLF
jgi:hypothetical protein